MAVSNETTGLLLNQRNSQHLYGDEPLSSSLDEVDGQKINEMKQRMIKENVWIEANIKPYHSNDEEDGKETNNLRTVHGRFKLSNSKKVIKVRSYYIKKTPRIYFSNW